jgi:hypothetical protein
LDDTIPPILHPQPQVIEEAPDGHAVDGGDADADADSGAEDMRVRARRRILTRTLRRRRRMLKYRRLNMMSSGSCIPRTSQARRRCLSA